MNISQDKRRRTMDKTTFWNKINEFFSSTKNGELWLYGMTLGWEEDDKVLQFDFSKHLSKKGLWEILDELTRDELIEVIDTHNMSHIIVKNN